MPIAGSMHRSWHARTTRPPADVHGCAVVAGLCFPLRHGDCDAIRSNSNVTQQSSLELCIEHCLASGCGYGTYRRRHRSCTLHGSCPSYGRWRSAANGTDNGDGGALSFAARDARTRQLGCESEEQTGGQVRRTAVAVRGLRVGIATLHYSPDARAGAARCHALGCGLFAWCSAALRLRRALPSAWTIDILLLQAETAVVSACPENEPHPRDCPGVAHIRPSAVLVALVRTYVAAQSARPRRQGSSSRHVSFLRRMGAQLHKWALWSLTAYDAILFADIDVDLYPERLSHMGRAVRDEWEERLPQFLGTGARLVGRPDFSSPINGGLFVLRPDEALYRDGLRVLSTSFDETTGWNRSGSPIDLLGNRPLFHTDGTRLMYRGRPASIDHEAWSWVCAEVDQGLFVYMLLARRDAARYALGRGTFGVDHFWSRQAKPWKRVLMYDRGATLPLDELCAYAAWLERSLGTHGNASNRSDRHVPRTPCARLFARARDSMSERLSRWRARGWPFCRLALCARSTMQHAPQVGFW